MAKRNRSKKPRPATGVHSLPLPESMFIATCPDCGKRGYMSRQEAKRGAARIHPGTTMRFYRCGTLWHMTSVDADAMAEHRERRDCDDERAGLGRACFAPPALYRHTKRMVRKFDAGYDFRSSESLRQRDEQRRHDRGHHAASVHPFTEGENPCARGEHCASSVTVTEAGHTRREPARSPRAFCDRDRDHIARCLEELPEQYVRLTVELGSPSSRGTAIRVPFGPRVPVRADIDALLRLTAESLVSWHERVADVARLSFPDSMRRDSWAVGRAANVLSAHLDAMLALPPLPMSRAWDLRDLENLPEGASGVIRSVFADVTIDLSGADAGLEILRVRYLARAVLGETRARPEELIGVPCRDPEGGCGWRTLVRAELPSREDEPVWWSVCARCGDKMTETEYREWTALCAAYERHRVTVPALENLPGVA